MRKLWTAFKLIMILPVITAAAGAVLAAAGFAWVGIMLLIGGAAAAGWWYMYFEKIDYTVSSGEIFISGGIWIKKVKRLSESNILWTNCVRLLGIPLFTVLHTGGGSIVVFAEFELAE